MSGQRINRVILVGLGISRLLVFGLTLGAHLSHRPTVPAASAPLAVSPALTTVTSADRALRSAEAQIARDSQNSEGYVALAAAYMRKVRESGDTGYYLRAEAAVQRALELQPESYEGLRVRAWIQMGMHAFPEALVTAEGLRSRRPDDPWVYGLLGDAFIELGDYDRAVDAFDQMMDLRPGLPAYSRVAHLRELFGDPQGAAEVMAMAVRAGSTRDPEPLAWCLVQYGNIHFNQGKLHIADAAYQRALAVFPHYPVALAALGRVRGAQQRYAEAIQLYQHAAAIVPTPETLIALGDLLVVTGKVAEAERQYAVVEYSEQVNALAQTTSARQLALFYADHDRNLGQAIQLAEAELERRHDIYTYDTLAWVYYKNVRYADAWTAMKQALRLGTQDALLFFHAGMIAHGLGERAKARDYLRRALDTNPYFSLSGVKEARSTLTEIDQHVVVQGEVYGP